MKIFVLSLMISIIPIDENRSLASLIFRNQAVNMISEGEVKIGDQKWMSVNLNVSHFRNGDSIPEVRTPEDWEKAGKEQKPAWCYYDNNPENQSRLGKLYNWYAVNDPRGLAPEGWHVSSDADWNVLTDCQIGRAHL